MQLFNQAYALWKYKFQNVYRDSWENYFEHLRSVTKIVLEMNNPNYEQVMIAILHDIWEDSDINFKNLSDLFWNAIALWVIAISKKSAWAILKSKETLYKKESKENKDLDFFDILLRKEDSILNSKYSLNDKFKFD